MDRHQSTRIRLATSFRRWNQPKPPDPQIPEPTLQKMSAKILIVGAGPTGLTTAIELARQGILPKIIDRRDGLSSLSRAVGITPGSLTLLAPSGAGEKLIQEGVHMRKVCVYQGTEQRLEIPLHSDRTDFSSLIGLPQDRTEAILAETLRGYGVEVQYETALNNLTETANGVTTRCSDGSEETFDYLVGADGVRSTVREKAGIPFPGFDIPQPWSIADIDAPGWQHAEQLTLIQARPGVVLVIAPMAKDRFRVVGSCEDALKSVPLPLPVANVRRESPFQIAVRQAPNYSRGSIHLAGDAAHCHSPVGGRGMNLGIADGAELAKRLVDGTVDGYSEARHPAARRIIRFTERARRIVEGTHQIARTGFSLLLSAVNASPRLQRRIGRQLVEI